MKVFLIIFQRCFTIDMKDIASGSPCNRMPCCCIPLHRRCETGIYIGCTFRHQADLQTTSATDQRHRLPCLRKLSTKAVVSSVWCEREATTTIPWCPIEIGKRTDLSRISSIEGWYTLSIPVNLKAPTESAANTILSVPGHRSLLIPELLVSLRRYWP